MPRSRSRRCGSRRRAPAPSRAGVGLPPDEARTSAVLLAANVESRARPSAPPICCEVLKRPDASPASSTGTPLVAIRVSGTKTSPIPIEASMMPGRMSATYVLSGESRTNSSIPITAMTRPISGTSRAPRRGISCCDATEPMMIPAVKGRNASPASIGLVAEHPLHEQRVEEEHREEPAGDDEHRGVRPADRADREDREADERLGRA